MKKSIVFISLLVAACSYGCTSDSVSEPQVTTASASVLGTDGTVVAPSGDVSQVSTAATTVPTATTVVTATATTTANVAPVKK